MSNDDYTEDDDCNANCDDDRDDNCDDNCDDDSNDYCDDSTNNRCGLPPLTSWKARPSELDDTYWLKLKEVFFSSPFTNLVFGHDYHIPILQIEKVYEKVDDIDLMLGGVAEKNVRGGAVGATFACIIGSSVCIIS